MPHCSGSILVVDDESANRILLATNLKEHNYVVEMAEDGQQALDMLHARSFDIVLLDLLMPKMDGFQVLERMKADSALQHIPVIVISAVDEMDSVIRCIEMGAIPTTCASRLNRRCCMPASMPRWRLNGCMIRTMPILNSLKPNAKNRNDCC